MVKGVLSDMDGVIYRGKQIIAGAQQFVDRLIGSQVPFLFLTNNSEQTPLDLLRKLRDMGITGLTEDNFITSAMATAVFLAAQNPGASAYVVGGAGLANELYKVGFSLTESKPDYVVVGKTVHFNFDMLRKASSTHPRRRQVHRYQSRPAGPGRVGLGPCLGLHSGRHRNCEWQEALHRRQTECTHDDDCAQEAR